MPTQNLQILERLKLAREKKVKPPYKGLAKKSAKKIAEEKESKELLKQDEEFYMEVWQASPNKCWNCNGGLGNTPHNYMFHHLLPKRSYPQFRHTKENIAILCLTCHSKCETNIDFAPKIKALTEIAKKTLLN